MDYGCMMPIYRWVTSIQPNPKKIPTMKLRACIAPVLILLLLSAHHSPAQHFGRNKVTYEDFDFRIYETPNFLLYHYLDNEEVVKEFAQLCERWYQRNQRIFLDTIDEKTPIILYNNHADFQQTTVIQDLIGVGVGGVTEGTRRRVVMPLSPSKRDTDHVLGHEMVHVFQFYLITGPDRQIGIRSLQNIPFWMIEGMAEYLSIGSSDVHTAMWMRDAVGRDDIPTLRQMSEEPHNYFPYRWGHVFLAYVGGRFGDDVILPLFINTARQGFAPALEGLTGYTPDSISEVWADDLRSTFGPHIDQKEVSVGERLFDADNAGEMNIAPAVSPDGENLVFISDKNVITLDFFLANIPRREISQRITNVIRDTRIDEYSYLESAGTWDPGGTRFALTVFARGRNQLVIADLETGRITERIRPEGVDAFSNPHWSPAGNLIALSGLQHGKSDLYVYDLDNEETTQLTDDRYSVMHPAWSPDGTTIAFVTDRESDTDFEEIRYGRFRLAEYDMQTGEVSVIDILPGADILNPKYGPGGEEIYFISNADGHRNLFRYHRNSGEVNKVTDLGTGISGISSRSPAFDIAIDSGELVYILYYDSGYELHKVHVDDLDGPEFTAADVDLSPAKLILADIDPPQNIVDEYLEWRPLTDPAEFTLRDYEPRFTLEHIGSAGIGVGVSRFGTGMAGGVSFLFGDMLRENILMAAIQAQGRIYDIAGQVVYLNQSSRTNWGGVFSHIPYRSAFATAQRDTIEGTIVDNLIVIEQRVFEDELGGFAQYPLSRHLRFEGGASASMYSFRRDSINHYYSGGVLIGREEHRVDAPESFFLYRGHLAYVGDYSRFGMTSPMSGHRYRFQVDRTFGEFGFWGLMADYRNYLFIPPASLAFRIMHFGRYGPDADAVQPIYVGNPFFVRGYSFRALRQPTGTEAGLLSINNLVGSKIAVVNAELRYPFTGPEQLALISSRFLFSDLVLFADGGLAWHDFDNIEFQWEPPREEDQRIPVYSAGIAWRINLFGAIILEPYFAFPFQRRADRTSGTLGFHLSFGGF